MGLGGRRICFQQDGVNGCRAMAHLEFALDKAAAAVYEGIAIAKIEEWYRSQGQKIHARYNEENGLEAKRRFDLIDTYGKKWRSRPTGSGRPRETSFLNTTPSSTPKPTFS
jgi:hypothetical protein